MDVHGEPSTIRLTSIVAGWSRRSSALDLEAVALEVAPPCDLTGKAEKMRVLLLNPPPHDRSWYRVEHLGIAYLALVLRQAGHEALLMDSLLEDLDVDQTYQAIQRRFPHVDVLGMTATEPGDDQGRDGGRQEAEGRWVRGARDGWGVPADVLERGTAARVSRGGLRGRGGGRRDPEGAGAGAGGG